MTSASCVVVARNSSFARAAWAHASEEVPLRLQRALQVFTACNVRLERHRTRAQLPAVDRAAQAVGEVFKHHGSSVRAVGHARTDRVSRCAWRSAPARSRPARSRRWSSPASEATTKQHATTQAMARNAGLSAGAASTGDRCCPFVLAVGRAARRSPPGRPPPLARVGGSRSRARLRRWIGERQADGEGAALAFHTRHRDAARRGARRSRGPRAARPRSR